MPAEVDRSKLANIAQNDGIRVDIDHPPAVLRRQRLKPQPEQHRAIEMPMGEIRQVLLTHLDPHEGRAPRRCLRLAFGRRAYARLQQDEAQPYPRRVPDDRRHHIGRMWRIATVEPHRDVDAFAHHALPSLR